MVIQKFQILRLLINNCSINSNNEQLHTLLTLVLETAHTSSYLVRNACFLLFSQLIMQMAVTNKKKNYSL